MPKTRIVILRMREVIYTAIFVGLGILLLIVLFFMFWPGRDRGSQDAAMGGQEKQYQAGVYTKELSMGDTTVNLQVTLDEDRVKSVRIVPLDESVTTMYPLIEPAVEAISEQLQAGKEVTEIGLTDESQYTEQVILNAVQEIIEEEKKN